MKGGGGEGGRPSTALATAIDVTAAGIAAVGVAAAAAFAPDTISAAISAAAAPEDAPGAAIWGAVYGPSAAVAVAADSTAIAAVRCWRSQAREK